MAKFLTIASPSKGIYKEKGSKFMAYAWPIESGNEVRSLIAELKREHPKADHICYAYILGANKKNFKCNDAGEPHNSAGFPILGQIKSFDVTNIVVAVVRYFGGTKLGVGGLANAYKDAAKDVLSHAKIIEDIERETLMLPFAYGNMPNSFSFFKENDIVLIQACAGPFLKLILSVPKGKAREIESKMSWKLIDAGIFDAWT